MAMVRMKDCPSVSALADELGVHQTVLYHWKRWQLEAADGSGERASSPVRDLRKQVRELIPMQGSLSIERMCQTARVSRAGFYRFLKEHLPREEDTEVRSVIQQIALEHRRRYGYRRVTKELKRRGVWVNHKRVARIMREDNLLAVQPKEFVTTTEPAMSWRFI